jgi:DNA-binding response OmpR family regulator
MKNRILIIDDDKELCEEILEILIDEHYSVTVVHDGLCGLKQAEENLYDILLLDLKLPSLSGFEILKKIRENKSNLKIIILSGRPFNEKMLNQKNDEELETLKLADTILSKPYDVEKLLKKIKALLNINK